MRVFISSTSEDLEAYRAAARDVVLHLGWQPVMMEYFGTDGSAGVVEVCAKKVADADVMLAILGWRRGGVPGTERGGDGESSFTKLELDAALDADKPVLVLMADDMWPGKLWEAPAAGARSTSCASCCAARSRSSCSTRPRGRARARCCAPVSPRPSTRKASPSLSTAIRPKPASDDD